MYRGHQIQTVRDASGFWHAHISRGTEEHTTLPTTRRFEREAWADAVRKIDGLIRAEEAESLEWSEVFK